MVVIVCAVITGNACQALSNCGLGPVSYSDSVEKKTDVISYVQPNEVDDTVHAPRYRFLRNDVLDANLTKFWLAAS